MLKKIFIIIIMITLLMGICVNVKAAELKTKLDVIQKSSETKYLENDQGDITKTIVDSNADTGEVTIELKLSNIASKVEKKAETEVILVIDNSPSMKNKSEDGTIRKNSVIDAAKKLTEKLFANSEPIKIGMVKFEGETTLDKSTQIMCNLTDNKDIVIQSLDKLAKQDTAGGTNILAGITKANDTFSSTCTNKIIILLTDGIPNYDLSGKSNPAPEDVYTNTKNGLITIGNSGTYIISMMTGIANNAQDSKNIEVIEKIFGTQSSPTVGSFYNISDSDINKIVTEDIYSEVISKVKNVISTVKVVDYFPEEITENFEFSYVEDANIGIVSEKIDEETKTISWDIGTLKGDEVATLKYKLKIKDMKNKDLLNKTIATNEKVVLTYKDAESKDYTIEIINNPKIRLTEIKEELNATVTYDPTTNTTGKVIATIKTNKEVNKVDGWTLSEDGKTLTKEYSENTTEIVHLVDKDNMTKDVEVKITNIIKEEVKDDTTAKDDLPKTGASATLITSLVAITIMSIVMYKKYVGYKDIK